MTSPLKPTLTLQSLPPEILLAIIDHLPWPTLKPLHLSNSIFSTLLPKSALKTLHTNRANHLYTTELTHLHTLDSEFWAQAEQVFLGTSPNYWSSYAGDPDLEATAKRYTCFSETLPCYVCLRWLPSSTAPTRFETESAFTRGRSTGPFDLGGRRARERMCIECGLRRRVYLAGQVLKRSVVCYGCGALGEPIPWEETMVRLSVDELRCEEEGWWKGWFCEGCWGGMRGMSREQFEHERRWRRRYEEGMRSGKEYRMEKGRRLRRERGVVGVGEEDAERGGMVAGDNSGGDGRGPNARYCPVMGERRL